MVEKANNDFPIMTNHKTVKYEKRIENKSMYLRKKQTKYSIMIKLNYYFKIAGKKTD